LLNSSIDAFWSLRICHSLSQPQSGYKEYSPKCYVQASHGNEQFEQPNQNVNPSPFNVLSPEAVGYNQTNQIYHGSIDANWNEPDRSDGLLYWIQPGGLDYYKSICD